MASLAQPGKWIGHGGELGVNITFVDMGGYPSGDAPTRRLDPVRVTSGDVPKMLMSPERTEQLRGHVHKWPETNEKHASTRWFEESKLKHQDSVSGDQKMASRNISMSISQSNFGDSLTLRGQGRTLAEDHL